MELDRKCKILMWMGNLNVYGLDLSDKIKLSANIDTVCKRMMDNGEFSIDDLLDLFMDLSDGGRAVILTTGIFAVGNLFISTRI